MRPEAARINSSAVCCSVRYAARWGAKELSTICLDDAQNATVECDADDIHAIENVRAGVRVWPGHNAHARGVARETKYSRRESVELRQRVQD